MTGRAAVATLAATLLLTACVGSPAAAPAPGRAVPGSPPTAAGTPPPEAAGGSGAAGGLDLAARGAAAEAYARARGGRTGIVARDRVTGEVWRSGAAGTSFRAASTVKLALAVDLLVRTPGPLDPADRVLLTAMIVSSDNAAADRLWARAGGASAGRRLAVYGLRHATGTTAWGSVRCPPEDLDRLLAYALDRLDPADRGLLVDLLRRVVPAQRWGVFGVVAATRPGGKNGWTPDGAGWAVATVGFLGPAERYTVTVMTAGADFDSAVATVSGTVTTLFLGLG